MGRLPGKKIDTWEWAKDRQVFKVDVRMASASQNGGMRFGVIARPRKKRAKRLSRYD